MDCHPISNGSANASKPPSHISTVLDTAWQPMAEHHRMKKGDGNDWILISSMSVLQSYRSRGPEPQKRQ